MKQLLVLLLLISLAVAQDAAAPELQSAVEQWDNSIVIPVGKESTVALDYISSGDRIAGAFKTANGEKINFFIIRERAGLEPPLARQYYVNEYEFNVTVPFATDSETNESISETTTYLLVFNNEAGSNDVTVYYRVKIEKPEEQERGSILDRIRRN
jgi:hypothetical protein